MKCSAHGPRTLDAKWLDPECWDGCQSLILKGQVNALREKLAIIWADSNYIRVEWLRENGHEEAAKAIENIRKHSAPESKKQRRVRWIPVTEQKPPPDEKVLAWSAEMASHGHAVSFGRRIVGSVIDECRFENTSGFYFTHWLSLPNPPNNQ